MFEHRTEAGQKGQAARTNSFRYPREESPRTENPGLLQQNYACYVTGQQGGCHSISLFISHFDLNQVNILIDENYHVSGIVDWELSSLFPFGMGLSRIHTLAGEFSEHKFYMPDEFEEAERGFWEEIFYGVPADIREVLNTNLEAVQTSVLLGTLLDTFELDDGKLGLCNPAMVAALPKFLSYRIPFLKGADPPYAIIDPYTYAEVDFL
jgi:hypothetical protein